MMVAQPTTVWTGGDAAALSRIVWSAPLVKDGAWLVGATVIVKVTGAEVFRPPLAVPPLSLSVRVMLAVPSANAAGVKVSVPSGATAGAVANRPGLVLFVTVKLTDWPDSL